MALICDTGPLYAAMNRADPDHLRCVELFDTTREAIVVPSPVLVELDWFARTRVGMSALDQLLADIQDGSLRVADVTRADYARVRHLCTQYADLELGFVDAAVMAIVERMGEHKLATLDHRHFSVVRPSHVSSLTLLPTMT